MIFTAVGVCWSVCVMVSRLIGSLSRRRGLGWEDGVIIATTVRAIESEVGRARQQADETKQVWGVAASTCVFIAVTNGFGQRRGLQLRNNDLLADEKVSTCRRRVKVFESLMQRERGRHFSQATYFTSSHLRSQSSPFYASS